MEYCEMGSLRQVLDSGCTLTWINKAHMSLDAAQGLYRSVVLSQEGAESPSRDRAVLQGAESPSRDRSVLGPVLHA